MRGTISAVILGFVVGSCSGDPSQREVVQGEAVEVAVLPVAGSEGERLFNANCAVCHAGGKLYPGYMHLKQNGAAEPSLARRGDLDPEYVKQVVRGGMGAMPAFTPTHVSDADIDLIATWLAAKER